jgi:xanthosine utilization system XapX-like protein
MPMVRWLALLPFLGMLVGPFFVNRVAPYILGMPFLLAWFVAWILLTAAIMAVIFRFDPANREERE